MALGFGEKLPTTNYPSERRIKTLSGIDTYSKNLLWLQFQFSVGEIGATYASNVVSLHVLISNGLNCVKVD